MPQPAPQWSTGSPPTLRWPWGNFPGLLETHLPTLWGPSHVFGVRQNAKHTWNLACIHLRTATPAEHNCPRRQPQHGGTIEDVKSGFPLQGLLFFSCSDHTHSLSPAAWNYSRLMALPTFCCRKLGSHAVTAKSVIKKKNQPQTASWCCVTPAERRRCGGRINWPIAGRVNMLRRFNWVYWSCMEK